MSYKFYLRTVVIIFLLVTSIFFLHDNIVKNEWFSQNCFMMSILFFAPTVLSLFLLYISIYALVARIEPIRKSGRAVTMFGIICALIFLLSSLIPPILGYFSLPRLPMSSDYSASLSFQKVKSKRNNLENMSKHDAQIYYRNTGQKIEYIDEKGNKILYEPDKLDESYVQNRLNKELFKKMVFSMRRDIFILVAITISSILLFLIFLEYKKKNIKRRI